MGCALLLFPVKAGPAASPLVCASGFDKLPLNNITQFDEKRKWEPPSFHAVPTFFTFSGGHGRFPAGLCGPLLPQPEEERLQQTGNAVNLTNGLDGLAIMPTALVAGAFALIAWATGNVNFAEYLHIPYIKYSSEVVVFCTAIVGAGLGFLWFNTYPAQVFMGDVGSLALGGALGVVAILVRQEFLLVIMGGVFVVEALSVILQVGSYKLRKQRIFRMAPIHHHFELKGWPEPRVIIRFWIISLMLVLMGLVTLKLR